MEYIVDLGSFFVYADNETEAEKEAIDYLKRNGAEITNIERTE